MHHMQVVVAEKITLMTMHMAWEMLYGTGS